MPDKIYLPEFTITNKIVTLVSKISETAAVLTAGSYLNKNPILRNNNRIKSIYSSLAIENNSFELPQVSDIIDGKTVIGPMDEIIEVRNAYKAYEKLGDFNPYSIDDLLKAHSIMMNELVREAGIFRTGAVGVFKGTELIHEGVHPDFISEKISALMQWCKSTDAHPLIKSCVFHYEFEFIHPFADGNGRTGRLWQTVILNKWNPLFAWLPVESLILKRQKEYYNAINLSNENGDSTVFIEFMLEAVLDSIKYVPSSAYHDIGDVIYRMICEEPGINVTNLSSKIGKSTKTVQRHLKILREERKVEFRGAPKTGGYYKI